MAMLGMYKAVVGSLNAQIRLLDREHGARAAEIVHFKQTLARTEVTSAAAQAMYDELAKSTILSQTVQQGWCRVGSKV